MIFDSENTLNLDEVLSKVDSLDYVDWRYLVSRQKVWLVIDPSVISGNRGDYLLSIKGNARMLSFYYFERQKGWSTARPENSGQNAAMLGLVHPSLNLESINTDFPIVIEMIDMVIPVMVFERADKAFYRQNLTLILTSTIIGALFFIVVVNFFRWGYNGDYIFGIYGFYILTFILNMLAFGGNNTIFSLYFIPPNAKFILHLISIFIIPAMAAVYGIVFLKLKTRNKPVFYILLLLILFSISAFFIMMVRPDLGTWLANGSLLSILVVLCYAGMVQWKKGHAYVSLYVIAYVIFAILFLMFTWSRNVNYASPYVFPVPIFYLGFLVEAFLLNLSLNMGIDFQKRMALISEQESQMKLMDFQAKQNKELEDRVKVRTSELEQTVKELKKAQGQLIESEKMASLGVLSAGVGHEINNPLNFIKGGIDGLFKHLSKSTGFEDSDTKRYLEIVNEGVNRASSIVNSLAHFSRENANMDEECDLHEILENCLLILQNKLKHKVQIVKNYSSEDLIRRGNEGRLHQAFLNILSNAEQAITKKGKIKISTKSGKDGILVSISDDGIGIEEEYMKQIMDPFFTTKDPGVGTGLGLSITYKIIEEHGGTIDVDSKKGQGSEFKIILPIV